MRFHRMASSLQYESYLGFIAGGACAAVSAVPSAGGLSRLLISDQFDDDTRYHQDKAKAD